MTCTLTINGAPHTFPEGATVASLLAALELPTDKVAVERNLSIVPRSTFAQTTLADGDAIEIVHFIGGG